MIELAATIALTHHEWFDGQGYPEGLAGDDIPVEGRIAAVADVFDALTHDRVYRSAFSTDEAIEMLREGRSSHFDPAIVDALEAALPEIHDVRHLYPDPGRDTPNQAAGSPADGPIRVLIVDDHDALARGLDLVLRREGLEIAGTAHSLGEAQGMLERRAVDVVLLDIHLGGENGLDLIPDAEGRGVPCLAYTGFVDDASLAGARSAGAAGLAAKIGPARELSSALTAVVDGESYFEPTFPVNPRALAGPPLTPRETEIVGLLANGLTGAGIAKKLFLSPETVRTHIRNAMDRVGALTRVHLIAIAGPSASCQIHRPSDAALGHRRWLGARARGGRLCRSCAHRASPGTSDIHGVGLQLRACRLRRRLPCQGAGHAREPDPVGPDRLRSRRVGDRRGLAQHHRCRSKCH